MLKTIKYLGLAVSALSLIIVSISIFAQTPSRGGSSYSPVVIKESFETISPLFHDAHFCRLPAFCMSIGIRSGIG